MYCGDLCGYNMENVCSVDRCVYRILDTFINSYSAKYHSKEVYSVANFKHCTFPGSVYLVYSSVEYLGLTFESIVAASILCVILMFLNLIFVHWIMGVVTRKIAENAMKRCSTKQPSDSSQF